MAATSRRPRANTPNPAPPAPAPRGWPWLAVALVACFGLKLAVLLQLHDHPLLQPHGELDTASYIDLARRLARDGILGVAEPFFVSPLYVYFLAAVFAAGGGLFAVKLLQVVLGTAAVALVHATARAWFGQRAAMASVVLATLAGVFTFFEVLVLQAAIDPLLVAATLYAVTRATSGRRPGWMAGAGVLLGLLALNRPNAIAYAPVAGVLAALAAAGCAGRPAREATPVSGTGATRTRGMAALGSLAAVSVGLAAVLGLNALRNYAASGQTVVIASHGGLNFYIGNHEGADGTYSPVPGIRPSIAGQATDSRRVVEAALGRPASEQEVSSHFFALGWHWIGEHPGRAAALFARKVAILVNRVNVPLNYSLAYFAREEAAVLRWLVVGPWLLFPLGLVGLFWPVLRVRRRGYWAWASFVPIYGLGVAVFFVSARYRLPLLVPLCAAAGAALVKGIDLARARRWRLLAPPLMAASLLALPVNWDLGLDDGVAGEQTRQAAWLVERGEYDQARAYAERVAPGHKHPGVLAYRLGQAYLGAGRAADAVESFQRAASIDGPRPAILLSLGRALMEAGRPADAVAPLRAAYEAGYEIAEAGPRLVRALVGANRADEATTLVASMPGDVAGEGPEGALDFGTLALEQGDAVAAERWLRQAVMRGPGLAEAHEKLGLALFLQGRVGEALPLLEAACRLAPSSASAHLNVAVVLAALQRIPDARLHAQRSARLDPSEPRAAALLRDLARRRP